jgi:hypothetical protein
MQSFGRSALLAVLGITFWTACGTTRSAAPAGATSSIGSAPMAPAVVCWPPNLAEDDSVQRSPVAIGQLQLAPADATPPPQVSASVGRQKASSTEQGATGERTVLATVVSPDRRNRLRAWVTVGCQVPFVSKGPPSGGGGEATVVTAVDAENGGVIFSLTQGA